MDGDTRLSKFSQGSLRAANINSPRAISRLPAILLSSAGLGLMANPVSPAIVPRATKIIENPGDKAEGAKKQRNLASAGFRLEYFLSI